MGVKKDNYGKEFNKFFENIGLFRKSDQKAMMLQKIET